MKKIIHIIFAMLTISTVMFAQIANSNTNPEKQIDIDKQNLKENAQKADIIVKGKVIKRYGFYGNYNDFTNNICTALIIRVEQVLKGNLQDTLIETYVYGGKVGNIIQKDNHPPAGVNCNNTAIYCLNNSKMIKQEKADTTTNLKMYDNLAAICTYYKKNTETKKIDILTGEYKSLNIVGEAAIYQSLNLPFNIINNANNTLDIFPNPSNDLLNITYTLSTNSKIQIQLINSLGQIVKEVSNQQTSGSYTLTVDTKPFTNGIYYIRFSDGVNIKQAKVIVQ